MNFTSREPRPITPSGGVGAALDRPEHGCEMPSYDFVCQDCGSAFERRLSMSAYSSGEGRECPSCGSTRAERSYTAVNVIAGGGGGSGSSASSSGGSCGFGGFT